AGSERGDSCAAGDQTFHGSAPVPPFNQLVDALCAALGIPIDQRPARWARAREAGTCAMARGKRHGLQLVTWFDDDYPSLLREIVDPPVAFWTKGQGESLRSPAVAVVGSRRAAPAGIAFARTLGQGL